MQTIQIKYEGGLEEAARKLVSHAPARGDYFGVEMRARHATTRAADIVAQYRRTIEARAASYGTNIPAADRARMVCGACGVSGCKMWRESHVYGRRCELRCGRCALREENRDGPIGLDGRRVDMHGAKTDQIGGYVPAVPTHNGTFWGYTSVPEEGVIWWRNLPTVPR